MMSSGECQCAHWVRGVTAWPLTSTGDVLEFETLLIPACDGLAVLLVVDETQIVSRPLRKGRRMKLILARVAHKKLFASHRTLNFHLDLPHYQRPKFDHPDNLTAG